MLDTSPHRKLLVLCHGNIFRSPLAAQVLRSQLSGLSEVRSFGFYRLGGRPSPPDCVAISAILGVDLTNHRSRVLTRTDIEWADTVVVMDRHNWKSLQECGSVANKVIWLGTMDGAGDIADPYSLPLKQAELVMRRVKDCALILGTEVRARRLSPAD